MPLWATILLRITKEAINQGNFNFVAYIYAHVLNACKMDKHDNKRNSTRVYRLLARRFLPAAATGAALGAGPAKTGGTGGMPKLRLKLMNAGLS
jgi:hypothetical protein